MTTPDQLAQDIDNAVAHSTEVDGSLDVSIDKALAAMRSAADALAAGASALHTARLAHNAQANMIRDDLTDTALMVRDLQVVQPEPVQGTWFGYTRSAVGKAGLAKPGVVRDFSPGKYPEVSIIKRTLDAGISLWYTWKPDLLISTWIDGVEAAIRQAVTPTSPPLYLGVWHEPEGSTDAGGGTVTAKSLRWRDAHSRLHAIALRLRADGLPVYVAPIICDWTFWDTSKGTPTTHWYPKSWQDYDLQGYDVYPRGQKANGSAMIARLTTTANNVVAPYNHDIRTDTYDAVRLCSEWAAECGKPWGSGETGIIDGSVAGADVQYPYTRNQRAQRFIDIAADVRSLDHPPRLMAWYSDGGCSLWNNGGTTDTASVSAWTASIAGNPQGHPAVTL